MVNIIRGKGKAPPTSKITAWGCERQTKNKEEIQKDRTRTSKRENESATYAFIYAARGEDKALSVCSALLFWNVQLMRKQKKSFRKLQTKQKQSGCCCCYDVSAHALDWCRVGLFIGVAAALGVLVVVLLHLDFWENAHNKFMRRRLSTLLVVFWWWL